MYVFVYVCVYLSYHILFINVFKHIFMENIVRITSNNIKNINQINKICVIINKTIGKIEKSSKMYLKNTKKDMSENEKYLNCAIKIKSNKYSNEDLLKNLYKTSNSLLESENDINTKIYFEIYDTKSSDSNYILEDLYPIKDINNKILIKNQPISQLIKDSSYKINRIIPCHNSFLSLQLPLKMLIVNCTPDSFSDKNFKFFTENEYKSIEKMICETESKYGIDIIDIGGESTRPFSMEISVEDEIKRVLPMIELIRKNDLLKNKIISLDTRKSRVIRELYDKVDIINDVSGLRYDEDLINVVTEINKPYIYCHSRGDPSNMLSEENTKYDDVVYDIINETRLDLEKLTSRGMFDWNIISDPGIGFAKAGDDNFKILKDIGRIKEEIDYPMLIAASKKRFLEEGRYDEFTNNLITFYSFSKGADIIRLHDINEGTNKIVELIKKLV